MSQFTESIVEDAALAWLEALGYAVLHGPDISPGGNTLTPALSQWEREQGRGFAGWADWGYMAYSGVG